MLIFKYHDRFDHLVFLKEIEKSRHGHRRGLFLCDCGNLKPCLLAEMSKIRTNPRSCGCRTVQTWGHIKNNDEPTCKQPEQDQKKKPGFCQELANKFLSTKLV